MRFPRPNRWLAAPAIITALALAAAPVQAQVDFDDLSGQAAVPAAYNGFSWSNFTHYDNTSAGNLNTSDYGYFLGVVSGTQAVYNTFGNDASISSVPTFTFGGAWLSAAFTTDGALSGDPRANAATAVQITGFLGAAQLYQSTFNISFQSPQFFFANWLGIDRLEFSSRPNPGASAQFVMDDIYFQRLDGVPGQDVVPEPATMTLLATGLAGMAAARRKKRKA